VDSEGEEGGGHRGGRDVVEYVREGGGSEVVGVVCWTRWKKPEILLVIGITDTGYESGIACSVVEVAEAVPSDGDEFAKPYLSAGICICHGGNNLPVLEQKCSTRSRLTPGRRDICGKA